MPRYNHEVLIARATVTTEEKLELPSRYHRLFQASVLQVGRTVARFPIKDHELSTDLTAFQRDYPQVDVKIDSNAIEEY